MASRQQREIAQQRRLLEQREARLAVLRGAQEPAQQDRLARLRHRLDQQQSKLNRLRLLRSQTDASRANNATLTSDLDCIRALFNEKEKELSLAVAKVEELTRQLEELRGRHHNGGPGGLPSPASAELEKLRRELLYRNKMNEQQNQVVSQQRLALAQRQAEMTSIDARIAQLQGRLQRKRALNQRLSQQLAQQQQAQQQQQTQNQNQRTGPDSSPKLDFVGKPRPAGNIAAIEPYSHIPNDNDFTLNKNDPKYQTLPYNTKFTVNFKANNTTSGTEDDVNKNKISHSAGTSQIRPANFQQFGGHHVGSQQGQLHQQQQQQQQQQQHSPQSNNINLVNNNNNNNNNTANHNYQADVRLLVQNAQQKQYGSTSSPTSSVSSSNQRNAQANHQKPVSSVAPSFPVKSPIYQTSSTKIHPVMPQTLSLIGRSYTSSVPPQSQNGRAPDHTTMGPNLQNGQQEQGYPSRLGYPGQQQQQQQQQQEQRQNADRTSHIPTYQAHNSPVLPQSTANSIFANYGYGQTTQAALDERLKMSDKSPGGADQQTSKHPEQASKLHEQHQQQQFRSEQNQAKFDHLAARFEQQQQQQQKHDHSVKFEPPVTASSKQLPEKPAPGSFEQYESCSRKQQMPGEAKPDPDKVKPALPPKPSKPNPPPRLTQHHQHHHPDAGKPDEVVPTDNSKPTAVNLPSRSDKEDDAIPPIPTSEPPESPTDSQQQQQQQQTIKARPLGLKKTPLSEQPKLRYAKSNVHVSINRRIEMPPAFLFPETEIPADLMQTESQTADVTDCNAFNAKRHIVSPVVSNDDVVSNEKLEDSDIVDALNALNIEDNKLKSETVEIEIGKPAADVIRRKKGNLKSTTGKVNLSRRVSFDPLALLLDASLEGELELVKKTAKEVANPSSANDEGITALHNAICAGHLEIVKFLVEFGCDVNAQDSDGWTPLHCAASCNNLAMVRFLVEHGACIFATTLSDHETAAEKCEEDEEGFDGCSEYLYSVQEKLGIMNNGQVFAVFDYNAQHSDELSLINGDSLVILRKGDDNEREWWWSKLGHREGYVPRNLLGLYPRVQPAKAD